MTTDPFEYQEGITLLKDMMIGSVTRMIVPSIMECNGGGFIVVIGTTMHGCSTLQEAFEFSARHAETHFDQVVGDLPRILRPGLWERARSAMLGTTTVIAFITVISASMWSKYHEKEPIPAAVKVVRTTAEHTQRLDPAEGQRPWSVETEGYPLEGPDSQDGGTGEGGPPSVPQMDLRKVQAASNGGEAEPGQYPDEARRAGVRTYHRRHKNRRRVRVSDERPVTGECNEVSGAILSLSFNKCP